MTVRLAFLGTGTSNSTGRYPSSTAVTNGSEAILIDCGGGAYHRLAQAGPGFSHELVSTIFLTHFHVDHVSGIPDFLWGEMWNVPDGRSRPLTIAGPPGMEDFWNERIMKFMGREIPFPVHILTIREGESVSGSFFNVRSFRLRHGDESTSYMLETGGKRIFFTGDTGYCPGLPELASASDVTVCEWSFTGTTPVPEHMGGPEIKKMLSETEGEKQFYFTHIYPEPGKDFAAQKLQCRLITDEFAHRVFFPEDLAIAEVGGQA